MIKFNTYSVRRRRRVELVAGAPTAVPEQDAPQLEERRDLLVVVSENGPAIDNTPPHPAQSNGNLM